MIHVHHVNLQAITGGGEIFTRALTRALADAGARVTLHAHPANRLWDGVASERIEVVPAAGEAQLLAQLPPRDALVLTQSPLSQATIERLAAAHRLVAFAHMPILGRSAASFLPCRLVVTVSRYCIELLRKAGIERLYPEPMYGVADLARAASGPVRARSPYLWDRRKARDLVLGALEPFIDRARMHPPFGRGPGIALGVVSLLSPIKQFPQLFALLAPHLARHSQLRLEIFGSGGYAQVRDLKRALAPLAARTRLWGFQDDVAAIYPQLDYLMTGLPEKEALGQNALEAQACGTPVLAPNAPPFTETVLDGQSGFLYRDPREDGGADFGRLIDSIVAGRPRPDPRAATAHLAQFAYPALVERAQRLVARLAQLA